jgi:DNA-binding transcriptional LysR family regulator
MHGPDGLDRAMKLRQLEVFRAVVETGTTKGAAHQLGISQPAVSTLIQHTEDQLGIELFQRLKGRLIPTEEALSLYAESSSIFLLFGSLQRKVEDLRQGRFGSLRIAATPSLGNSVLPQAIHSFVAKRPGIRVSVDIRERETIFHHVSRSVAELGVVLEFREHPNLTGIPIHRGQFVCAIRADHPLAANAVIHISDLRGMNIVRLERGTVLGDLIDRAASGLGEPLNWSVETRYCATACSLVEHGESITIVDEYSARNLRSPKVVIKPLLPAIPIAAFIVHASDRPLSKLAKLLVADIRTSMIDTDL